LRFGDVDGVESVENCVVVEVCVASDVNVVCTMRWKKNLRYNEYPKVDTTEMEFGVEVWTKTGQAAVGRCRRSGNCDRQDFRSFRQWYDDNDVGDFLIGALKDWKNCVAHDSRNYSQLCVAKS